MIKTLLSFSLLIACSDGFTQWPSASNEELACEKFCILELFPENDPFPLQAEESPEACFLVDAGMMFLSVRDAFLPGTSFNIGAANDHFASSLSFDGVFSRSVNFPSPSEIVSPYYYYLFFGWDNQYLIHPRKKITLALDLKMGWGYENFSDRSTAGTVSYYQMDDSSSYYSEQSYYSSGTVASDNMFVLEPGVNFLFDIMRHVSIGAGAHSRIVLGVNAESPLGDTGFYSGNIFLRFRIFGRNAG